MDFGPCFSQSFKTLSRRKNTLPHVKLSRLRGNSGCPPTRNSSFRLNPSGTGRRGFIECTIESGMTMALVQEDIWKMNLPNSITSEGVEGQPSRGHESKR